ncbi:branched-chain amino acid ABC transporter permease [Bradyrhizobium canariense]|uniref:branched-chain amino acid ABC transporter permease n=1 Tax=Bradyrhizobium canariense TaxID=255045 RepID=UPI001CA58981|nr:branched-chain amino acid ABC transporter permease [Bradyrhizobium canariense]MBW5435743.1 branched-chain amino acid ABC transporter permease [Bradyrhizobium canariense]
MKASRSLVILLSIAVCVALPPFLPRHFVDLLVFAGIYTVAGLGVGLLLGQCGIANLGQIVFYAIGAYATAYLTVYVQAPAMVGFVVGMLISAALALTIGWPILRLTGYFLALATLAMGIVANALFFEWDWLTGGTLGIGGIPKLQIFSFVLDTPLRFYYLVLGVVAICLLLAHNLIRSRTGLALRAMRDSQDAAISLAVNPRALRTRIFILSALLGSVAGSLFAHYGGFANVQSFGIEKSINFLLIPVLGGATSLIGVVVGALFIAVVPELLSQFGGLHQILFGVALIGVVVLMPAGLTGALAEVWRRSAEGARP